MCIEHGLLRSLQFLLAGSGKRERQVGFANVNIGLVDPDLLPVVGIIQTRQQGACLNRLAFLDRQLDDAPLHLEAHQALMRFDIAGERELIFGLRFPE